MTPARRFRGGSEGFTPPLWNQPLKRLRTGRAKGAGFTLIEILIVMAIIAVLATVSIAALLRARLTANETGAIASLKAIMAGCQLYSLRQEEHVYPNALAELTTPATDPPYLDTALAGGEKQGYLFTYERPTAETFAARAAPVTVGITGARYFFVDESGVIRMNQSSAAGPTDPVLP